MTGMKEVGWKSYDMKTQSGQSLELYEGPIHSKGCRKSHLFLPRIEHNISFGLK